MCTELHVNVNDESAAVLLESAAKEDVTVTEIFRRMVGLYKDFHEAEKKGLRFRLVEKAQHWWQDDTYVYFTFVP